MLFVPKTTSPLRDILNYYLQTVSPLKRSHKTEVYRIKALCNLLGNLPLVEISQAHMIAYRDKRLATPHPRIPGQFLAGSTVKLELMLLSHVFSTAITEWGMESLNNPVLKVRKPRVPPGRTRRLTAREETRVRQAALRHPNREFYAIIVLALETAMRQGEILGLLWQNVSWKKRTVLLPMTKNGEVREVPLSCAAYNILRQHMAPQPEGLVFSYSSNGIKSSWRSFIKALGIPDCHFHDLRHTCCSALVEKGLDIIEVAAITGHKTLSMVKRYSHLHAYKLVSKLDPKPKAKRYRPVLKEQLSPYPAVITQYARRVDIVFPDFIDLHVSGREELCAKEQAKSALLRTLIEALCAGMEPPVPSLADTISALPKGSRVTMISPL
jgi:integrase